MRVARLSHVKFHWDGVWEVDRVIILIHLFPLFFELLLLRDCAYRSYIIEVAGIGVKIFRLVREIFDDNYASDHENHVFFTHHLKLVGDGSRIDTE